jgi:hypothetical protein
VFSSGAPLFGSLVTSSSVPSFSVISAVKKNLPVLWSLVRDYSCHLYNIEQQLLSGLPSRVFEGSTYHVLFPPSWKMYYQMGDGQCHSEQCQLLAERPLL